MPLNPEEFPLAESEGYIETSPDSTFYNCIAYAAGDLKRNWWPKATPTHFWPKDVPQRETIFAFLKLYRNLGYVSCKDESLEEGFEKIAIYALNQKVKHAARQLPDGNWTSKLGRYIDVKHFTLKTLEGPVYGEAVRFLKRQRPPIP